MVGVGSGDVLGEGWGVWKFACEGLLCFGVEG